MCHASKCLIWQYTKQQLLSFRGSSIFKKFRTSFQKAGGGGGGQLNQTIFDTLHVFLPFSHLLPFFISCLLPWMKELFQTGYLPKGKNYLLKKPIPPFETTPLLIKEAKMKLAELLHQNMYPFTLTLLHTEWLKLYGVLAILSAIGLRESVV